MNKQTLNLEELFPVIEEVISSGGEFRVYPKGVSMLPLIRQEIDSVVLVLPKDVAEKDMVLYRRDNGQFVLHRVVEIKNDEYIMCGDNQTELEYGIKREHLLAKVAYFYREDEKITLDNQKYQKYVKSLPRRRRKRKIRIRLARIKNKIFGKKTKK